MLSSYIAHSYQIFDTVFRKARRFRRRHRRDRGISQAFGILGFFNPLASLHRKRLRTLFEALETQHDELNRTLCVVDLGCGGGFLTSGASLLGHSAIGVDQNPEQIRLARLFAEEETPGGGLRKFMEIDLLTEPDWEKKIQAELGSKEHGTTPDVIILGDILHQLEQTEAFVERLSRWLDHGAVLIISEKNPESLLFRLSRRFFPKRGNAYAKTYLGWKRLLESKKFKVGSIIGVDPIPGLSWLAPLSCWSLVFAAHRR